MGKTPVPEQHSLCGSNSRIQIRMGLLPMALSALRREMDVHLQSKRYIRNNPDVKACSFFSDIFANGLLHTAGGQGFTGRTRDVQIRHHSGVIRATISMVSRTACATNSRFPSPTRPRPNIQVPPQASVLPNRK